MKHGLLKALKRSLDRFYFLYEISFKVFFNLKFSLDTRYCLSSLQLRLDCGNACSMPTVKVYIRITPQLTVSHIIAYDSVATATIIIVNDANPRAFVSDV